MTYTFADGVLTCSGGGTIEMRDWVEVVKNTIFEPDEYLCVEAVEKVVIEKGVTSIGEEAFYKSLPST